MMMLQYIEQLTSAYMRLYGLTARNEGIHIEIPNRTNQSTKASTAPATHFRDELETSMSFVPHISKMLIGELMVSPSLRSSFLLFFFTVLTSVKSVLF